MASYPAASCIELLPMTHPQPGCSCGNLFLCQVFLVGARVPAVPEWVYQGAGACDPEWVLQRGIMAVAPAAMVWAKMRSTSSTYI